MPSVAVLSRSSSGVVRFIKGLKRFDMFALTFKVLKVKYYYTLTDIHIYIYIINKKYNTKNFDYKKLIFL